MNSYPEEDQKRADLKESIKNLLDTASHKVPATMACPNCGRIMPQVDTTFALFGSNLSWNISLPFCNCKREKERAA